MARHRRRDRGDGLTGARGAGLYDDDNALDLKNSIALLAKIPADGERLLQILRRQHPEPGKVFWRVVADQFERRGIAGETVLR